MKVVQLGCGVTGLVCAEHLERHPKVDEIVLADKRLEPAESLVERTGTEKATLLKADAGDKADIRKMLRGCDVLVSAVPSEMNARLLDAALASGVDYVDFTIPLETIPRYEEIDAACAKAGITALTAMGSDPGISDIFALHNAAVLDSVTEVHIKDADNAVSDEHEIFTLWCPRDMLEEVTMNAAVYEDGGIRWLPPLSRKERYAFPAPIGTHTVYNTTHEETFLIPRFLKDVKYVDFMIVVPDALAELAATMRQLGLHGLKPVVANGSEVKPLDVVAACMPSPVDMVGKIRGSSGIFVDAVGEKDGERRCARTRVSLTHQEAFKRYRTSATGYLVGTGAAVGAEMLLSGDVRKSGLFLPEMLSIDKYLKSLRNKGLDIQHEILPT